MSPEEQDSVRLERISTELLAAILIKEGDLSVSTHPKRMIVARRAVEWADALIDALEEAGGTCAVQD